MANPVKTPHITKFRKVWNETFRLHSSFLYKLQFKKESTIHLISSFYKKVKCPHHPKYQWAIQENESTQC